MKPLILSLICLAFFFAGSSQRIRGTVKDSVGKPVPFATINLKSAGNNRIISYAVSDAGGAYTLSIPAGTPLSGLVIEATSVGYKTGSKPVADLHLAYDFTLGVSANQLKAVEIKNTRPVLRMHGDTLDYNVADFAGAQDMVIGDVLKKMPGITMGTDGTVYYNNKRISALYIDGDNLLDDKYNIATTTIPHAVVQRVQVIQGDQPIKIFQNKVMSDDVALNLTIKKGAKMQVVGLESVGAGLPGNYDVDGNAMLFKDKYKAINYLKGNNTGYDLQQELVAHNQTNHEQMIDNAIPSTLLSLGTVNDPALSRNRYLFNQSALLNLNNLVKIHNDVQLRMNAWYFHDNQRQDYSQQNTIFLQGDTVRYDVTQHNRFQPDMMHGQFTLNINRKNYYLNDALTLEINRSNYQSYLYTVDAGVNQSFRDNQLNFSNELNWIRSGRSNDILQTYSYISHSAEPEKRTIGPNYEPAIFNDSNQYAQLIQTINVPTWYTTNYVSLKIPSGVFTQSFKTGFSVQSQQLTSDLNVAQINKTVTPESDSSINRLDWSRTKFYAEAAYDLPGTILQANLTLPVNLQQINYSDGRYKLGKQQAHWYFNPQLNIKYKVGAENYLSLSYRYRNETSTIEDIYQGYILKDYRQLYANSAGLAEKQHQTASAGFSYRRSLILLFASLNIIYDRIAASSIASAIITNNLQRQIMLPYSSATDFWTVSSTVSKYSFELKTTFSAGIQWQSVHSVQFQNEQLLPFNTITQSASLGTSTKVGEHLAAVYTAMITQTASHSVVAASANHVDQLKQQATLEYVPAPNWQFKLSGEHYFTRQQGNTDLKYFFADASARFKAGDRKKATFELSALNFINVKTYSAFYISANTFTASSYALPGRIVTLKVMWNL
jgi:hypothetical protein